MTDVRRALLTNNVVMLLYGVSAVLIGPTLPGMIAEFDLTLSAAGLVGTLQNTGGFLGAIIALLIADRISRPAMILTSFGLLSVALFTIGSAGTYPMLLVAFAFSGLFIRIVDVMLNAHTGDLAREESGKALSTLHMFFSIGAFAGPLAAGVLMGTTMSWSGVYHVVAVAYIVVLISTVGVFRAYVASGRRTAGTNKPASRETHRGTAAPVVLVGVLSVLLLFYAVHQIGVISWLPYYLETARSASPDLGSLSLSLYWVGIIAGRFVSRYLVDRVGAERILCLGVFLAAAASAAGVLVVMPWMAAVFFAIAGLTSGATIPLAYSVGYSLLPTRTGSVTAWMAIVMLAGRTFGPWFIGATADRLTLIAAMLIPSVVLIGSGLLAVVILLTVHRVPPTALVR